MTNRIAFSIGGRPVQWQRAGSRFGQARVFTPRNMRLAEKAMKEAARAAMGSRPPMTGPVRLTVVAVYAIPKSWPKRLHEAARNGTLYHTSVPDLDNLVKLPGDSLNGVAYVDDSQVAEIVARKRYGDPERTDVEVRELAPDDPAVASPPPTPAELRRTSKGRTGDLPLPPGKGRRIPEPAASETPSPRLL